MKGTPEKTKRNKKLYYMRLIKGSSYTELAKTFDISRARAKQLFDKEIKNRTKVI